MARRTADVSDADASTGPYVDVEPDAGAGATVADGGEPADSDVST